MVTEDAAGINPQGLRPVTSGKRHHVCIYTIAAIIQQLAVLDFPTYGSCYFEDAPLTSLSRTSVVRLYWAFSALLSWGFHVGELRSCTGAKPNREHCELKAFKPAEGNAD